MKRVLVGTPIGRIGLNLRDALTLAYKAFSRPEAAGTLANDILASTLVTQLCQPNKTFIDVGAHIGSIIAEVVHHVPTARIIAFEAIPEKVEFLRRKFPKVEIHDCALSESEGETKFYVDTKHSGYSSLGQPKTSGGTDVAEIPVRMTTLDKTIDRDDVDVIKIDVEGAELGVLRGGDHLIRRCRPTILFESGPPQDDGLGYSKEAIFQWFAERDYLVMVPNRLAHEAPSLTENGFIESHFYPRRTTNYFAVHADRRIEIRDRARRII